MRMDFSVIEEVIILDKPNASFCLKRYEATSWCRWCDRPGFPWFIEWDTSLSTRKGFRVLCKSHLEAFSWYRFIKEADEKDIFILKSLL